MTAFDSDTGVFLSRRVVPYSPEAIFQAFAQPESLARWWGPSGFTNTIDVFEFRPGGRWKFVMHGPDGANFPNESTFVELAPSCVVIRHMSKPHYVLTVMIAAHEDGTEVTWNQQFEDVGVASRIRHIVEPANEQNLDRLVSVLAGEPVLPEPGAKG